MGKQWKIIIFNGKTMENHHSSWENDGNSKCFTGKLTSCRLGHFQVPKLPEGTYIDSSIQAQVYILPVHSARYPYNLFDILHQETSKNRILMSIFVVKTPNLRGWFAPPAKPGDTIWLVVSTPLKNMEVNWDDYSQYMEK